jgi:hypothetical protein
MHSSFYASASATARSSHGGRLEYDTFKFDVMSQRTDDPSRAWRGDPGLRLKLVCQTRSASASDHDDHHDHVIIIMMMIIMVINS